jgi:WD40 repeat protein
MSGTPEERSVTLWDWRMPERTIKYLVGHGSSVDGVAFSAEGRLLASGSGDRTIRLWDVAQRALSGRLLDGNSGGVNCVRFLDNSTLVSGSSDGSIRLWDLVSRQPIGKPLIGHHAPVTSIGVSSNGLWVASGDSEGVLALWPVEVRAWQTLARKVANRPFTEAEQIEYLRPEK